MNHWIWQRFNSVLTRPKTFSMIAISGFEGTWNVGSIEHYKIKFKYSHWVLSRFFFSACTSLSSICGISSRVFIQAPNFEIVGCQNLLILSWIHNGCLYITEPKRRTSFTFTYSFSSVNYAIWTTKVSTFWCVVRSSQLSWFFCTRGNKKKNVSVYSWY